MALSGGVFQNLLLLGTVVDLLESRGFRVLTHSRVPPNDGGISLGQAGGAAAQDRAGGWPAHGWLAPDGLAPAGLAPDGLAPDGLVSGRWVSWASRARAAGLGFPEAAAATRHSGRSPRNAVTCSLWRFLAAIGAGTIAMPRLCPTRSSAWTSSTSS